MLFKKTPLLWFAIALTVGGISPGRVGAQETTAPAGSEPAAAPDAGAAPTVPVIPMNPVVVSYLREGYSDLRAGNADIAIQSFNNALKLDPKNREARFGLGTAMVAAKQEAAARDILTALAGENPNDYILLNNLAWLHATATDLSVRDGDRAIRYARAAVVLQPNDYHIWSTLTEAYYVKGDYERALRSAQEALRLAKQMNMPEDAVQSCAKLVDKCRTTMSATNILEF